MATIQLVPSNQLELDLKKACNLGDVVTAKTLLRKGANVNYLDKDGFSPLMGAALKSAEVVRLLLEHGAQVDLQGKNGLTALMVASDHGHNETIKVLVEYCAQLDLQGKNGLTALMLAIIKGHNETVKVLVKHGAQVELKNKDGMTALMVASRYGHHETVKLLQEYSTLADSGSQHHVCQSASEVGNNVQPPHHDPATLEMQRRMSSQIQTITERLDNIEHTLLKSNNLKLPTSVQPPSATNEPVTSNTPTLSESLHLLLPLAGHWHNIGVLLNIHSGKLETIENDKRRSEDCLRETLKEWLKQTSPRPTWRALAETVEHFDPNTATTIRGKMM